MAVTFVSTTRTAAAADHCREGQESPRIAPISTDATKHAASEAAAVSSGAAILDRAVFGLLRADPDASAARRLAAWQACALAFAAVPTLAALAMVPRQAVTALLLVATVPAICFLVLRIAALREILSGRATAGETFGPCSRLPVYSVLVPLYHEAAVLPQLVAALEGLDYPKDRLDILLVVERHDVETRAAISSMPLAPHVRVVVVPDGLPRTKPRALNYALAFARGSYVVVYDAEDQPEPDQLRKALAAFAAGGGTLGCVQARLNIYNPRASWLTRQFTLEYTALFDAILPALGRRGLPIPLGGTSNHFPRQVLDDLIGWDPFNVTEDADLGLRLARRGYGVAVLGSTTWEEAPTRYRSWLGQRTRWLKGWMQTWLVHMRRPRRLWREIGPRGFLAFNILTGGGVLSALAHPWVYFVLALDLATGKAPGPPDGTFGSLVWWLAGAHAACSYGAAILLSAASVRARGYRLLARSAVLLPVYWLAISVAAHRALVELVIEPHHWEKTKHEGRTGYPGPR